MSRELERLTEALADRYTIERQIGRGGMSTVYLAVDQKHGRQVAMKVLLQDITGSIDAERFQREIEIVAHLVHPNIIPILDSGHAGGFLYHVTPYIEGETLRQRLERERQLPVTDAVRIAQDIAEALDYAHAEGVIHRDIKPENVLLTRRHAVVMDFGIARAIQSSEGRRLTATGIVLGSPAYMSPEQASGERNLDGRSDIYALACVVYEMLCGKPPLVGRTALITMTRRIKELPAPLRTVRETVPHGLEESVGKALARLPADRFSNAQEFGDALVMTAFGATVSTAAPVLPRGSYGSPGGQGSHTQASFWSELRRRKVYNVAAFYAVAATAVLGIADATFEPLGFPTTAMRILIVGAIAGFPLSVLLAWIYELTSNGIRRTQAIDIKTGSRSSEG